MLAKIKTATDILRNLVIIFFVGGLIYSVPPVILNIRRTLVNIESTSRNVDEYITEQKAQLSTEKNKKAIDAGLALAASMQGTVRLVNAETIPRINGNLDQVASTVKKLEGSIDQLNGVIEVTKVGLEEGFVNINGLVIEVNRTVTSGRDLIESTNKKTGLTLDEINGIIASPEWLEAARNISASTANVEQLTAELKQAGASAPSIAKSVEEIAKTTSKYRKAVLLSQIISAIGRAFF